MKTNAFRLNWLFPVLGIALIGGGYSLTKSYLRCEQEIRSADQCSAICDRLYEGCQVTRMLIQARIDGCAGTARNLDELVDASIVAVNSELASADTRTRLVVKACFEHIARWRSANASTGAGWPAGRTDLPLFGRSW